MKRRVLITLLTLTMTAAMITGCGNKPVDSLADESTVESTVEATEETTVEPTESEPENEPSSQPETEEETPVEDSTEDPSEESTPETEPAQDESQPEEKPQAETEPKTEIAPETTPVAADPVTAPDPAVQAPAYNVTAMSATMYVKNSVNLRQGPGTDYSKVGSLNKGDQVNVTGQADNGWYQLDSGAFVSNKYLTNDAPVAAAVPGTVPVATVPGATDVTADPMTTLPITIPNQTVSTGADFLNYLNQQRSAAGLGTLRWDDGMAAVAQRRAQEITKGLDHSGNAEQYGEVIQQAISGSATEWYNNWYNSEAHRTSMFGKNYTRAGVGVYAVGNNYFVVCNFQGDEITTEQLIEQFNPDNMVQIGDNAYIGKDDYDAMINAGIDPGAQPDEEANRQMDEQNKLLDEGVMEEIWLN